MWSIPNSKMAESSWDRERFVNGRARAPIDAMDYFENQRIGIRGRGRINIGRAGIVPRALNKRTQEDGSWDEGQIPCGRVGTLLT